MPMPGRLSIQRKLTLLMMLVSGVALLAASVAIMFTYYGSLRSYKAAQLVALADVTASNSTAAISFGRRNSAAELLASLDKQPTIQYACIFDEDGEVFASYRRHEKTPAPEVAPEWTGHRFQEDGYLVVSLPVAEGDDVLGRIYVLASTADITRHIYRDAGTVLAVIAVSLVIAVLISLGLQRVISRPILALADTAQKIGDEGDYSIRVRTRSKDEIGTLYEYFNRMLEQIQSAEEAIRGERDYSSGMIQGSPSIVVGIRPDGSTSFVNPTAERLTGYTADEIVGKNWWRVFYPGDEYRQVEHMFNRFPNTSGVKDHEMTLTTRGGEKRTILWNSMQRHDEKGELIEIIGFGIDITDRKLAEGERERMIAELETKNAELERFAYTVSHDLKTPLITIKGYAGLLEQDLADGNSEAIGEDLQTIAAAAEKMSLLLAQVLQLSRVGRVTQPSEEVPLDILTREVLAFMDKTISAAKTEVSIGDDLPVLYGDRVRLYEVLQNLIENAVKYIGDQPKPRIEIGAREDGDETVCFVRDNGMGIEARYHDKVFDLFDQLDPNAEGSGVGLALVRRIVQVHGGRIWVESEGPETGSTFCFTIPPKPEDSPPNDSTDPVSDACPESDPA